MPLNPLVVYEDEVIIVINKPHELITHQKNLEDTQPTVVDWVLSKYPELKNIGEPFMASGKESVRAGILHRLDKETSGLLLIAKNDRAFFYFKNLFQTRKIKKYYIALVHGTPKNESGIIKSPLGRIGLKRTTRIAGKKMIDQKEAETEYKVIRKFEKYSLLELRPKTGRTHQLRVHLKSIGHPITGDSVYGFRKLRDPEGLQNLFLHAYKLEFTTPADKALSIEADLPEELQKILNTLK